MEGETAPSSTPARNESCRWRWCSSCWGTLDRWERVCPSVTLQCPGGFSMAQTISTGMEAYACDGTKIGAVRRLFSAEAPAAAEAIDAGSTASSNLEDNEFTQLSEIPATYNVGTAGSMGSGPA